MEENNPREPKVTDHLLTYTEKLQTPLINYLKINLKGPNHLFDVFLLFKNSKVLISFLEEYNVDLSDEQNEYFLKINDKEFRIFHIYSLVPCLLIRVNISALSVLQKNRYIQTIDGNFRAYLSIHHSKILTKYDKLQDSLVKTTGKGVKIALFDSGVSIKHKMLRQNLVAKRFNLTTEEEMDLCGHGTMIACILAGSGMINNVPYQGYAPNIQIIDVKIIDKDAFAHV
ncbi:MAG: S8 family serine peptidase, partial [Candidatus Lokiarchaeota archaeon]|nr:S8 family serine peptidase [Candidatus Lokiarchaeota archaeon]